MLAATGWMALSLADSPSTRAATPSGASGPAVAATEPVVVHVVRSGETLWGIATLIAPERDPRIVIEDLREVNALPDSSLQVGQVLELPKAYLD
jgi:LysM repeat protein